MVIHSIDPVYDESSRVLILGSFPSVRSREEGFFYGHPQNRFWKVLSVTFGCEVPETVEEKKRLLLERGIALWDVIASCEIEGSSDNSIKNVLPNDITPIIKASRIEKIFLNGRTAEKYYNKYIKSEIPIEAVCLPSTSPANASWTLDVLSEAWGVIKF
ncbi:MAG: DNA-deoxyinosine glycosylase [Clostridia bacterium]|nr:DNA-deoxyinosine glycosylase [Clostridia bacterium]